MIFAVGIYEHQVHRLTPEFERDSQQYLDEAFGEAFHSKKTTQMRIVPVNRDIPVERNVTSYDDLRAYVESSSGPFARMTCICRHGKELLGHKCKQTKPSRQLPHVWPGSQIDDGARCRPADKSRGDAGAGERSRQGRTRVAAGEHQEPAFRLLLLRMLLQRADFGKEVSAPG